MVTAQAKSSEARSIAYFSMEIALDDSMPTYAGGFGVLAGDTMRAAADLGLPMLGVTLLHRKGYLRQHLNHHGRQTESADPWSPQATLDPLEPRVSIVIEGRTVRLRAWRYLVRGVSGCTAPVYLLDSALPENDPGDRTLTNHLYAGDARYRLCQEVILGIGGVAMLRALGHSDIRLYHMNECHSSLLALPLLEEQTQGRGLKAATHADMDAVRHKCVFTVHTPVAAGHDRFPTALVGAVLGTQRLGLLRRAIGSRERTLSLTSLAAFFSRSTNAVSQRHGKVSRIMFPGTPIRAITNGVHAVTWASPPFARLYDERIPGWRSDNHRLSDAAATPLPEIRAAHLEAKRQLLAEVKRRSGVIFDPASLMIAFAKRATGYKRADLFFSDLDRLRQIVRDAGPLQVVYGGKAHARDDAGKGAIERVFTAAAALKNEIRVVYLKDYDVALAKYLVAGVDLWLNTPQKPLEASGTSGMKAALNGVPSLSILDGWWLEGCVEGVTGWAIGDASEESDLAAEVESLYHKLERVILPMFYERPDAYADVMRSAIAVNGSVFNAQRMMQQYARKVYQLRRPTP